MEPATVMYIRTSESRGRNEMAVGREDALKAPELMKVRDGRDSREAEQRHEAEAVNQGAILSFSSQRQWILSSALPLSLSLSPRFSRRV